MKIKKLDQGLGAGSAVKIPAKGTLLEKLYSALWLLGIGAYHLHDMQAQLELQPVNVVHVVGLFAYASSPVAHLEVKFLH